MIDEQTIRQWFYLFKGEGKLTEIRLLAKKGSYSKTLSGYFTDVETMLAQLRPYADAGYGIYATLNAVKEACYGRDQHDALLPNPVTTGDGDIAGRDFILVDIDPKRASGTNATDIEKKRAQGIANRVYHYLANGGFSRPVVADSANGVHLYYRVQLANSEDNKNLVRNFLAALSMMFSDEYADIDVTVFNASRIVKVIGTSSNKGANTADRPRRMSRFVYVPESFNITERAYFEKVAAELPKVEKPSPGNNFATESFDIDAFIRQHGIAVHSRSRFGGGEKIVLEECPFDSSHKHPDAAIFRMDSGAIGFKCLHNSCSHYTWKDVRLHFDPNAYDRRDRYEFDARRRYYSPVPQLPEPSAPETEDKGKKWLQMSEIKYVDPSGLPHVPTGITRLDNRIMGLMMGDLTIVTGLTGSGKTVLIDNIILNIVQRGFKAAVWSGELQDFRFQSWIDQIAAGRNNTIAKAGYTDLYFATRDVCEKVNRWLDGKLFLYNNDYGNKWSQLFNDIKEVVAGEKVKVVILDNLMALSLTYSGEKNDRQTQFVNDLKNWCKGSNVHCILVCHPRKEQSFQLLRAESVAGSGDLVNFCDNLFIVHRVGRDFTKRARDFFDTGTVEDMERYDNVLEVCKNRSTGVKDLLVGLYYEKESRRMKNEAAEYVHYGWEGETQRYNDFLDSLLHANDEFDRNDDMPEFLED